MSGTSLLLVLCASSHEEAVRDLLEKHGAAGFTEIPEVLGSGATGKHLGTRAFPGESSLIFTVVHEEQMEELVAALREMAASCPPGEGVKVYSLAAEEVI